MKRMVFRFCFSLLRGWEANPVSGEELESIAKRVIAQPSDVIEQMKRLLGR